MLNHFEPHDYSQRLHATYVRYKGRPYYCEVIGQEQYDEDHGPTDYNFRLSPCNSKRERIVIDPKDEDLDISSLPLGYLKVGSDFLFLKRVSLRAYPHKQAVDNSRILVSYVDGRVCSLPKLLTKDFEDMVMGNYTDFKGAYNRSVTKNTNCAIHIHFCISRDQNILYKNEIIGHCISENQVVVEKSDKSFLYVRYLSKFDIEVKENEEFLRHI